MLQQPQVVRKLRRGRGDSREGREERVVRFARIRLSRDTIETVEAELPRDEAVQLVHFRALAEQLEERCFRPRRAARAAEADRGEPVLDLLDVEQQVLDPQRGALADCGRLRGLE